MVEYKERGKIENRNRKKQIIDMSGLRYNYNITPTDVDGLGIFYEMTGFLEIKHKAFIFFELKLIDAVTPKGQSLAFTRLVDDLPAGKALFIVAEHDKEDWEEDIIAHLCIVRKYYSSGKWHVPTEYTYNLKEVIDMFLKNRGLKEYVV